MATITTRSTTHLPRSGILLACLLLMGAAGHKPKAPTDEEAIKAIYVRYSAAIATKDINTIMSLYSPSGDLVVFDAFPPRQEYAEKEEEDRMPEKFATPHYSQSRAITSSRSRRGSRAAAHARSWP